MTDTSREAVESLICGPLTEIARSLGIAVTEDDAETCKAVAATLRALIARTEAAEARAKELEARLSYSPYDHVAHEDDHAVNRFAAVMKGKLEAKRLQGRGGWSDPQVPNGYLSRLLRECVDKGDPVDVANLAMMIHQRKERIAPNNEGASCAQLDAAEARVKELERANAALRAANDMLLRAITGDDNE